MKGDTQPLFVKGEGEALILEGENVLAITKPRRIILPLFPLEGKGSTFAEAVCVLREHLRNHAKRLLDVATSREFPQTAILVVAYQPPTVYKAGSPWTEALDAAVSGDVRAFVSVGMGILTHPEAQEGVPFLSDRDDPSPHPEGVASWLFR